MNRRLQHALATVLVAGGVLAAPQAAHAYPQDIPNETDDWCDSASQTYTFDPTWTTSSARITARQWAREAIALWNGPLDYTGDQLLDVDESVAGTITVTIHDFGADNPVGDATCTTSTGPRIRINSRIITDEDAVRTVAAHEMGHLLGLGHSGDEEAVEGRQPIMATCSTDPFGTGNHLSSDDESYVNWRYSAAQYYQMNANYGFEQGTRRWTLAGGTWEELATGGAGGVKRIRHKTTNNSSYIQQRVRVATGTDDHWYRVVFQYKVESASATGFVKGIVYRARLSYAEDVNDCGFEDDLHLSSGGYENTGNYDDPSQAGFIAMVSTGDLAVNKTSWTRAESDWYDPLDAEGYEFDIRVYSHAEVSGVDQWVYLDNARAEGCGSSCT